MVSYNCSKGEENGTVANGSATRVFCHTVGMGRPTNKKTSLASPLVL